MNPRPSRELRPIDIVMLLYLVVEIVLIVLGRENNQHWGVHTGVHIGMILGILGLHWRTRDRAGPMGRFLLAWYPVLYIPLIFTQLGPAVFAVRADTYDHVLQAWDQALFGGHPGVWLDPWASTALTEALRACWLSYFAMPFVLGIALWRRKGGREFEEMALALVTGWLVSFLGYYTLPAMGPGYFHESHPAPAVVSQSGVTDSISQTLFALEGQMPDVFPSGHTIVALIVLWQAARHRVRGWPVLIPIVIGLLLGTVYLRYHYGVDIVAGALIAIAVIALTPRWLARYRQRTAPSS